MDQGIVVGRRIAQYRGKPQQIVIDRLQGFRGGPGRFPQNPFPVYRI